MSNMYFKQTLLAALLAAATTLAAPAPADPAAKSMMVAANVPEWIIERAVRTCDQGDNTCTVKFSINPQTSGTTPVSFVTTRDGATGASRSAGKAQTFGDYTITSGWSGQFGEGNGFTVFAVVRNSDHLMVYPGYSDADFADGRTVSPDKMYKPQYP